MRSDAKAAKTMQLVRDVAADHLNLPVETALIVMPPGTYRSGHISQYADGISEDDPTFGAVQHPDLPNGAQILVAVTERQVHLLVVRPKAGMRGLRYRVIGERAGFVRADLEVRASKDSGLLRLELAAPSTGRREKYETWTTYGNDRFNDELLASLSAHLAGDT